MWFGIGKSEARFEAIKKEFDEAKEVMQNEATRHLDEAYAELAEERSKSQRKIDEIQNAYNKDKQAWAKLQLKHSELIENHAKVLAQELAKERSTSQRNIDEIQTNYNKERFELYKKLVELSEEKKKLRAQLAREQSIGQQTIGQILKTYNMDQGYWRECHKKQEQIIALNGELLDRERALTTEQNILMKKQNEAVNQTNAINVQLRKALETPAGGQDIKNRLEAEKEAHAETARLLKELEDRFHDLAEQEKARGPWGVPTAWRPRKIVPVEDDNETTQDVIFNMRLGIRRTAILEDISRHRAAFEAASFVIATGSAYICFDTPSRRTLGHILSDTFNLTFLPHYVLRNIIQAALVYLDLEWDADRLLGGGFVTTSLQTVLGLVVRVHGYLHSNPVYAALCSGFIATPLRAVAGLAVQVHCFLHSHPGYAAFGYGFLCICLFDYWVPDQPEQASEALGEEPLPVQRADGGKTKDNAIRSFQLAVARAMSIFNHRLASLIRFGMIICILPIFVTVDAVSQLRSSGMFSSRPPTASSGPETATALQEARDELAKERSANQQKILGLLEDHDKDRKKWASDLERAQNTATELQAESLEAWRKTIQTLSDLSAGRKAHIDTLSNLSAEKEAHMDALRTAMALCKEDYDDLLTDSKAFRDTYVNAMEAFKENVELHKKLMVELQTFLREGREEREQKEEPEAVGAWGKQVTWAPSRAGKAKKNERG
ncbi:hypothetical protein G7Y79_00025g057000 [Physcia stellaris]|nr:hypothetical protein G7Y79_00025g057000 [Physcia stellaris]